MRVFSSLKSGVLSRDIFPPVLCVGLLQVVSRTFCLFADRLRTKFAGHFGFTQNFRQDRDLWVAASACYCLFVALQVLPFMVVLVEKQKETDRNSMSMDPARDPASCSHYPRRSGDRLLHAGVHPCINHSWSGIR